MTNMTLEEYDALPVHSDTLIHEYEASGNFDQTLHMRPSKATETPAMQIANRKFVMEYVRDSDEQSRMLVKYVDIVEGEADDDTAE